MGIPSMQGSHQVAHTSRTVSVPLSCADANCFPERSLSRNAGAAAPTLSPCRAIKVPALQRTAAVRHARIIRFIETRYYYRKFIGASVTARFLEHFPLL